MEQADRLLRVADAVALYGLCERQLRQMIADGRLRAVRLKGLRAIRIRASVLDRLIEDRGRGSAR